MVTRNKQNPDPAGFIQEGLRQTQKKIEGHLIHVPVSGLDCLETIPQEVGKLAGGQGLLSPFAYSNPSGFSLNCLNLFLSVLHNQKMSILFYFLKNCFFSQTFLLNSKQIIRIPFSPRMNQKVFGYKYVFVFEISMAISAQTYALYKYVFFRYQTQYITSNGKAKHDKPYILNQKISQRRHQRVGKLLSLILSYYLSHLNLILISSLIIRLLLSKSSSILTLKNKGNQFNPLSIC